MRAPFRGPVRTVVTEIVPVEREEDAAATAQAEQKADVTFARLLVCLESAAFWARRMPEYAAHERRVGNRWAIWSGALAAVTGLAVWPLITEQAPPLVAGGIVSGIAFASAICALVMKVNRYTEMAERGQELAAAYGQLWGHLLDLTASGPVIDQKEAHAAITQFQRTKTQKDKLDRTMPSRKGTRGRTPEHPSFADRLQDARELVQIAQEQAAYLTQPPAAISTWRTR